MMKFGANIKNVWISCWFITIAILILISSDLHGQSSVRINAGYGISENISFSAAFKFRHFELIGGIGMVSYSWSTQIASGGLQIYPFEHRENSELRKWYFKFLYTYEKFNSENDRYIKSEFVNFRIGREFRIAKHVGFQFDIGYMDRISAMANYQLRDLVHVGYIGGALNFFYRFNL